jgi:hypothetical protein
VRERLQCKVIWPQLRQLLLWLLLRSLLLPTLRRLLLLLLLLWLLLLLLRVTLLRGLPWCGRGNSRGRRWMSATHGSHCWVIAQPGSRQRRCSSFGPTYGCCCWSQSGSQDRCQGFFFSFFFQGTQVTMSGVKQHASTHQKVRQENGTT